MTEREYVEYIKERDQLYIDGLGNPDFDTIHRWEGTKAALSAHTAIALCDAWLTANPSYPGKPDTSKTPDNIRHAHALLPHKLDNPAKTGANVSHITQSQTSDQKEVTA